MPPATGIISFIQKHVVVNQITTNNPEITEALVLFRLFYINFGLLVVLLSKERRVCSDVEHQGTRFRFKYVPKQIKFLLPGSTAQLVAPFMQRESFFLCHDGLPCLNSDINMVMLWRTETVAAATQAVHLKLWRLQKSSKSRSINDAGWSSLVARRAHNPKVVSSNLPPATISKSCFRIVLRNKRWANWCFRFIAQFAQFKSLAGYYSRVTSATFLR